MATFTAVGVSTALTVPKGQKFRLNTSGTFVALWALQKRVGAEYRTIARYTGNVDITFEPDKEEQSYRLQCLTYTSGTLTYTLAVTTVPLLQQLLDRFNVEQFAADENGVRAVNLILSALLNLTGIEDTLTAHAGGTQAAALALDATKTVHRVSVCATDADSVSLPVATVGAVHLVMNSGASSLQVFGAGTSTINDVATATGVAVGAGKMALFVCVSAGKWYMLLGA